jgi:hypothetical protein
MLAYLPWHFTTLTLLRSFGYANSLSLEGGLSGISETEPAFLLHCAGFVEAQSQEPE